MSRHFFLLLYTSLFLISCKEIRNKLYELKIESTRRLHAEGKFEEAWDKADGAVKMDSSRIEAYIERGKASSMLGNYTSAFHDFSIAFHIDSTNVSAIYQKGLTFTLQKEYDSSIVYYDKAIQEKGSDTLYFELNKSNPLLKDITQEEVEMNDVKYCRGFSYYMLNKYDKAMNDFEFCLSNGYNNHGSVFLYSAIIYLSKGFTEKACNFFDLATKNGNMEAKGYISKYCNKINSM